MTRHSGKPALPHRRPNTARVGGSGLLKSPRTFGKVLAVAALVILLQRVSFYAFGTSRTGTLFFYVFQFLTNGFAIACAWANARRSQGAVRLFWILFGSAFALHMIADLGWAYCRYFYIEVSEGRIFPSFFYRLYVAP